MSTELPNVVLVVADDLGVGDLGAYGGRLIATPAIDRLAATGVLCEAMYAAAATDTPSRAGLLTGRYGARYGLPASLRPGMSQSLPPGTPTVATRLGQAGYATALFGQWRLGRHPLDHGFQRFAGTLFGADVTPLAWYDDRAVTDPGVDLATIDRRIVDETVRFVDAHPDQPFLVVASHLGPTGPYGDAVERFDYQVGRLVRLLRGHRRAEHTLVIVTSDNGPFLNGHTRGRRGRKPEVYDGGVRVPFIASWLRNPVRRRDTVPRSLLDVLPSLCAGAGVEIPDDLDGTDLFPLLSGGGVPDRGPVYLFSGQALPAVRAGRWKLHTGTDIPGNRTKFFPQLFDVDTDVREAYNLAARHPDVVAALRDPLEELAAEVRREAMS